MKRAIIIAAMLTFVVSTVALAALPTTILFQDSFDAYSAGLFATNATAKWAADTGFNYTIVDLGGGNKVVQTAAPTANKYAWTAALIDSAGYNTMFLHFEARTLTTVPSTETRNREKVIMCKGVYNTTPGQMVQYQFGPNTYKSRIQTVHTDYLGAQINYNDGLWHSFDLAYDLTTDQVDWYVDNVLYDSQAISPLDISNCNRIAFMSQTWNAPEKWQYDNFVFGTNDAVPEPGSILALLSGLVGFVAVRRRR